MSTTYKRIVSSDEFESLREMGILRAEQPYEVYTYLWHGGYTLKWAWSPDGEGVYWYDTPEDMEQNHSWED